MNRTQKTTTIIYLALVFLSAMSLPNPTVFNVAFNIVTISSMMVFTIGIIALIKGDMPGWGIRDRGVAIVVILASLAPVAIVSLLFVFISA